MKLFLQILIALVVLYGCSNNGESTTNPYAPLNIICTTSMLADLASNIVGNEGKVQALMGPSVDPHYYKATQGDLQKMEKADVIIYNGLHLEGKMQEVLEHLSKTKTVITATQNLPKQQLLTTNESDKNIVYDPHVWHDVILWQKVGNHLKNELVKEVTADKKLAIENNFSAYSQKLTQTHNNIKSSINEIPESQRILITSHDAFSYYGKQYNIEVKALQGISTVAEFGLKDIYDLTNFIVDRSVKTVFVESSVSDKSIKAVVDGCKEKGYAVSIGGYLYSDAMGKRDTEEGTYLGMIKHNTKLIVNGLK